MKKLFAGLVSTLLTLGIAVPAQAQVNASDSVFSHAKGHRLSVGGYGEVAYSRNFYSDNVYKYKSPGVYKDADSHGRFDIPHAVIYLGYDFGVTHCLPAGYANRLFCLFIVCVRQAGAGAFARPRRASGRARNDL